MAQAACATPKPNSARYLAEGGSLGRVDIGGYAIQYGPSRHQGSTWVELTMLSRGNRFVQ